MMTNSVLIDIYLHHRTKGGKDFFRRLFEKMASAPLYDGAEVYDAEHDKLFVFLFEPFTNRWVIRVGELGPMDMVQFTEFNKRLMYQDACAVLYQSLFEGRIIELTRRDMNLTPVFYFTVSDMVYMEYLNQRLRAELNSLSSEKSIEKINELMKSPDEEIGFTEHDLFTTHEELLCFYFKPEKKGKESVFYTASTLIDFIQSLHPGFWKLNEEETGKLLNSEGFSICKGRNNQKVRGYFLKRNEGFDPQVRMKLKVAS
jgi:hypothetical protein